MFSRFPVQFHSGLTIAGRGMAVLGAQFGRGVVGEWKGFGGESSKRVTISTKEFGWLGGMAIFVPGGDNKCPRPLQRQCCS